MALTESEQKLLDDLLRKRDNGQPENTEPPVVMCEIWDGDKSARLPLADARPWLEEHFGITALKNGVGTNHTRPGGDHH
jgi:hypothetical protein